MRENEYIYTPDITGYKKAVWDFLLEHCDMLPSGALFVKFHIDSRHTFENRVLGRWKHNYHRDGFRERKNDHQELRKATEEEKAAKRAKWLKDRQDKALRRAEAKVLPKWKRIINILTEK